MYAKRDVDTGDIFILSDTYTDDPTKIRTNGLVKPTFKCAPVSNSLVVCFSGDIFSGHSGLSAVHGCENAVVAVDQLCKFQLERNCCVDFVVCDVIERKIWKVSDGKISDEDVCWIGSKPAFERFQEIKLSVGAEPWGIEFATNAAKGNQADSFLIMYFTNLDAFCRLVLEQSNAVGGICVPYVASATDIGYGCYARTFRPPALLDEIDRQKPLDLHLSNCGEGGFSQSFVGDRYSFVVHIPQIGFVRQFDPFGKNPSFISEREKWTFFQ